MNKPARSFGDLIVWQKAHQFVLEVYRFTRAFPSEERYGLTSQIRRAAVSVPANIAEEVPKRSAGDKTRFFNIAQGSLEEGHYDLILANDLRYGNSEARLNAYDEARRLLTGYARAILALNSQLLASIPHAPRPR
jgi:four helix bundle protein